MINVHEIICEYERVNNITTRDDGDVVRRVATNCFVKLIMLDFLFCCKLVNGKREKETKSACKREHMC
jgi:hypothetical protein